MPDSKGSMLEAAASGQFSGGSVPGASSGLNLDSLIHSAVPSISDEMVKAAFSPSFTSHALSVPAKMTMPVTPFRPTPLNEREVVGAGNARARGIGNSITALTNIVGQVATAKAQQKQTANAQRVSQLLEYQQGIDQAQEILKNDPNNAEAKKAVEQNTQNRNIMFEDPKFVKMVQKGFDISFTDPEANKTPDHAAVQQGVDMAKQKAQAYGQQWAEKQPLKPTPNILAMQQLQMAQATQAQYAKVAAAVLPKLFAQRDQAARTQYIESMKNYRQTQSHLFDVWKLGQQFQHDQGMAGLRHKYRLGEIQSSIQLQGQKMEELFMTEKLDPTVLFKTESDFSQQMARNEGNLNSAIGAQLADVQKFTAADQKKSTPESRQLLQSATNQLNSLYQQQKNLQEYKNSWYKTMGNLKSISAGMSGGIDDGAGAGVPAGSGQQPSGGGPNTFDPSTLLYGVPWQYGASSGSSAILPAAGGSESEDEDSDSDSDE